jgi:hypothetical protein
MKASTYLSIAGLLSMVFGAVFLVLTPTTLPMYGLPTDPANLVQGRYFAATLFGYGLLAYMIRNVGEPATQRAAVLAGVIGDALGTIVSLWGLMDKSLGPLAWSSVVIYGGLLAAGLYCLQTSTRVASATA